MKLVPRTRAPLQQLFPTRVSEPIGSSSGSQWPVAFTNYEFPVLGQGTISFTFKTDQPFRIVLASQKDVDGTLLVLEVGLQKTALRRDNGTGQAGVIAETTAPKALIDPGVAISYWLSLDYLNARVRFGKGEMLPQLVVFEAPLPLSPAPAPTLPAGATAKARREAHKKAAIEAAGDYKNLRYIGLAAHTETSLPVALAHLLWPLPVVLAPPPVLVPSDRITLDMIARNQAAAIASLPNACQVLYGNVAGPAVELDTPEFPDFSAAINYSIVTPGCICYEKLKEKAGEFGKSEPDETYLRITIGPNKGDSPGSPYVLEIWPGNHYSPIHDHGEACAVIKVLHGDIWVELYPELSPSVTDYFTEAVFHQGEVTYLTPEYYQVHKLVNRNPPGNMTATIQCYRYPDNDTIHWEYFDYIDGDQIKQFTPNSDWEYLEFRALIRAEWAKVN
ncbi:hypothetical protein C0Z18_22710 [Trinickia dabaoshanensis]|uniref:Cysteine dioxygenase n=1 Tax=Trinickia dabaoshanensis TaxID=564714 RepID=A0A2N7VHM1_9BURK|nr:hypothetical protein [Trinickia dabaoshanensis]PMS16653.1 hypothetical protein C0Z18_22710 [Trinickia dabaoshanensis]